jgi:hypothetical protein
MNEIKKAFYDVMYKYQKYFSEPGVNANLMAWEKNKGRLTNLLRHHPNWNEQELAIIFDLSVSREIERDVVDECKFALSELVNEAGLSHEQRLNFDAALLAATAEYSQTPSENSIATIKTRGGIKCSAGQKTSRIIGRLCNHYGIDRHRSYNQVFARLADAFNPLQVQKTGVLSVHPCDFLEMSNKDNTWTSCHGLDHGSYQSGCLSYLADAVTMIFFTVDDNVKNNINNHANPTRQVFCYTDNLLLQSRRYPDDNNEQCEQYRGLVQKAIADCLGTPNLWTIKAKPNETEAYFTTVRSSRHYADYNYYRRVSLLKGAQQHGHLHIGHPSICVCCGEPFQNGRLKCNCENLVVCADCGQTVSASNARYSDGAYYCNACLHICAACHQTIHTDMYPAFNRAGRMVEVCTDCYQAMIGACASCCVAPVCGMLAGARFCQRTAITAAAA